MYYRKDNDCDKCKDCINDPSKDYCNTECKDPSKNCYETYKVYNPNLYGKIFINPQVYENLFNLNDAFTAGTIFKDLYNPYCDVKYTKGVKNNEKN